MITVTAVTGMPCCRTGMLYQSCSDVNFNVPFSDRSSGFMPDTVEVSQNKLTVLKVDDSINNTFICEVTNSLGTGKDQVAVFVRGEFTRLYIR